MTEHEAQLREVQRLRAQRQQLWASMTSEERGTAYLQLSHAVQSATMFEMSHTEGHSPKHLRTGLNITMAEFGGLATLLVSKGLITEAEYHAAIVEGLEAEVIRFEHIYPGIRFG